MSQPSYTPGPWWATERSNYHEVLAADLGNRWYGTRDISGVAYADTDRPEVEQVANARLIAAAPELFEALEKLKPILDRAKSNASGNMEWEDVSARVNAACAALAKARREQA